MEKQNGSVPAFGMRDKLGYMFGDFGNDFTFILSSMLLMKFYSDVMGVSVGIVGIMMMAARFVDAFTDITMGQIVDRSKPGRKGKFLPWIRRMSGPVAIASFLMYASWFADMPMGFKIFWMFFTYLLWGSIFYTSINIPYGSMASAITGDPKERAELSTWRTIGATLASTVISVVLPLLIYYRDEAGNQILSATKSGIAAAICSVSAIVCYFICYSLSTERVKVEQKTDKFSLSGLLRDLVTNRALVGIVVCSILMLLVQLVMQGMTTYVYPNYFGNIRAQSAAGLAGAVVTLLLSTIVVKLQVKFGRKELAVAGSLFGAAAFFVTWLSHTRNAWVYVLFYSLAYLGLATFTLICWAMITDVIDNTEVQTGERSDGTIYSVYSFARKLGQAAASGVTGGLLTLIGYTAETQFEPEVTKGIFNLSCLVPAMGFLLLGLALQFLYPLNKKRVEYNAKVLSEKQENT